MSNPKFFKSTNVLRDNESLNKPDIIIYMGVVEALEHTNTGRIKVRIQEIDSGPTATPTFCNRVNNRGTDFKRLYKTVGTNTISSISFDSPLGDTVNDTKDKIDSSLSENNSGKCNELPWSNSLLPLNIQTRPKVGEIVMVIMFNRKNEKSSRVWVGPIIPYTDLINFSHDKKAKTTITKPLENIPDNGVKISPKVNDFTGSLPEPSDVALMSRNNADIVLPSYSNRKDNITKGGEVLIRAGKFKIRTNDKGNLSLNDENITYFRLKQLKNVSNPQKKSKQPDTHAMLFADYISIVSHINGEEGTAPNVRKINPIEDVSTDSGIRVVHNNLSPLIRGDQLILFLELLRDYVKNHNHPYHKHSATNTNSKPDIEKFDLNRLLSTNIRIN